MNKEINNRIKKIFRDCPLDLDIKDIDKDYILGNINIDNSIRAHVDNEYNDVIVDDYIESRVSEIKDNDWKKIDEMFS